MIRVALVDVDRKLFQRLELTCRDFRLRNAANGSEIRGNLDNTIITSSCSKLHFSDHVLIEIQPHIAQYIFGFQGRLFSPIAPDELVVVASALAQNFVDAISQPCR